MTHRFETAPDDSRDLWPADVPARSDLLRVRVSEPGPGVVVVAPAGEVDLSTVRLFRDAVLAAVDAAPDHVIIDLSGLTFCGSTGLVVLLDAAQRAEIACIAFTAAGATPIVRRVLDITGLRPVLGHRDSVDEVLREVVG
jgi:stage II sporulation protein AA (anti-sigma F factor antagonist)